MKLISLLIGSIFITLNAFSGNEFSGGHIVENNLKYELFEFYEFGISSHISIPIIENDLGSFKKKLKESHAIKSFGDEIENLVSNKLNQIYLVSPEFSVQIFHLINRYEWKMMDIKDEMVEPEDIGPSPINYSELKLIPAALRLPRNKLIYIKKSIADLMERKHLVGLIFHEALSDYVQTTNASYAGSGHLGEKRGSTVIARVLTTYLFSENFFDAKFTDLRHFMLKMGIHFYYTKSEQFPTYQEPRNLYKYSWKNEIPNAKYEFDIRHPKADDVIRNSLPLDLRRYTSYQELNEVVCANKRAQLNHLVLLLKPFLNLIHDKLISEINQLSLKYSSQSGIMIKVSGVPIDSIVRPELICDSHYCNFYDKISKVIIGKSFLGHFDKVYETVEIDWHKVFNYSDFQTKSNFYRNFVLTNLSHASNKNTYKCFTWDEYNVATQASLFSEVK